MKNVCYITLFLTIGSCNLEGVKQDDTNRDLPDSMRPVKVMQLTPDSLDTAFRLLKQEGLAPEIIDYDTIFGFVQKKVKRIFVTPSGVRVEVFHESQGATIKKGQVVSLAYRGKLISGKIIETSAALGNTPFPFYPGIGMTLPAFDEVIQLLHAGDEVRFTVPAIQAYGKKGHGQLVPPNSDIVYEMTVLGNTPCIQAEKGVNMYYIIKNPLAPERGKNQKWVVRYSGWTESGKLFDASVFHGKDFAIDPASDKLLKGWEYCLKKMRKGEKCLVYIPASLGYGATGVPEMVSPNSNLIYILEVKDFN